MIILLCNFRTGSTSFAKEYSEKTGANCYIGEGGCDEYLNKLEGGYKPPDPKFNLYKIMPEHAYGHIEDFEKDYLDNASEIIYLARKNFTEQVLSFCTCIFTQQWHPSKKNHRFNTTSSYILKEEMYNQYESSLLGNLNHQIMYYKKYPGKLYFLEDRFSESHKYPGNVIIQNREQFHSDVNVEELFMNAE